MTALINTSALSDTLNVMTKTVSRSPDGFATGWAIHDYDPVRCPSKDAEPDIARLPVQITDHSDTTDVPTTTKLVTPSVCYTRSMEKIEAKCDKSLWRLSGIVFYDTVSTPEGKVLGDPQWFINAPFLPATTDNDKIIVHGLCD